MSDMKDSFWVMANELSLDLLSPSKAQRRMRLCLPGPIWRPSRGWGCHCEASVYLRCISRRLRCRGWIFVLIWRQKAVNFMMLGWKWFWLSWVLLAKCCMFGWKGPWLFVNPISDQKLLRHGVFALAGMWKATDLLCLGWILWDAGKRD